MQVDSLPAELPGKPKNMGADSLFLLQQIFLTQKSTRSLLHCRRILYQLSYQGSYFGYLVQTANSLEKSLILGKVEGRRRRGCQRMRWLDGITNAMEVKFGQTSGDGKGQGSLACCSVTTPCEPPNPYSSKRSWGNSGPDAGQL